MDTDTPNIRSVRAGEGRTLFVTWKGGAESPVDVGEHIAGYAVFAPLTLLFARCWSGNGDGTPIGPTTWKCRPTRFGDWRWSKAAHGFGRGVRHIG